MDKNKLFVMWFGLAMNYNTFYHITILIYWNQQ